MNELSAAAIDLLKDLIAIPSFSQEEDKTADRIGQWFDHYGIPYQRSGNNNVIELHGSIWRMRCESEGLIIEDLDQGKYHKRHCKCGNWLRPDIIWFQDMLDQNTVEIATNIISTCDLFVSIGTSALVWPAAGYPKLAKSSGAYCVEVNPEETEVSYLYNETIRLKASEALESFLS